MTRLRRTCSIVITSAIVAGGVHLLARQNAERSPGKQQDTKRPKVALRAQPSVAVAPPALS